MVLIDGLGKQLQKRVDSGLFHGPGCIIHPLTSPRRGSSKLRCSFKAFTTTLKRTNNPRGELLLLIQNLQNLESLLGDITSIYRPDSGLIHRVVEAFRCPSLAGIVTLFQLIGVIYNIRVYLKPLDGVKLCPINDEVGKFCYHRGYPYNILYYPSVVGRKGDYIGSTVDIGGLAMEERVLAGFT